MKIIHTGDVHIGSAFKGLPMDKSTVRKAEILDNFRRLCAYAKESGVSAVLIVGDLFDSNSLPAHVKKETFTAIALASPVRFFYVSGNHDDGVLSIDDLPTNLYRFSKNHTFESYFLDEEICISGIDLKNINANSFTNLTLSPNCYNFLLMHGDVNGEIELSRLQNKFIDYLALGHIHKPTLDMQKLDGRGRYRYCGCLEGRGFDEIGDRGFFLLEVKNGTLISEKFLSFSTRKTVCARVDISACESYFQLENTVLSATASLSEKDMVKIILCGTSKVGLRKDISLLTARLGGRFFAVRIEDESRLNLSPAQFKNDLTERGEFVREAGRYEMNAQLLNEVLEVGLKALDGEEIDL